MGGGGGWSPSKRELEGLEELAKQSIRESAGRRNVFISFSSEDLGTVNLLRGQTENENVPLDFNDHSVKEPIDSERAEYIKSKIREKIERSSVTLVYLSDASADSAWVDWEVQESIAQGKGVIGVYAPKDPPTRLPPTFARERLKAVPWDHEALMKAIEAAAK